MWYVIQVAAGAEERAAEKCRSVMEKRADRMEKDSGGRVQGKKICRQKCFIPRIQRKRKYLGQWHMEQRPMFPGYVFLDSEEDDMVELLPRLRDVQDLAKVLWDRDTLVPVSDGEAAFLKRLGGEEQLVAFSVGRIDGERITITSGPLRGLEEHIQKIDRHKRLAWLCMDMMGKPMEAEVGLEIVEKR